MCFVFQISPEIECFEGTRLRGTIQSRRKNINNNNNINSCESANRSSLSLFRRSSLSRKSSYKKFSISRSEQPLMKPIKYQTSKTLTRPIPPQSLSIKTHDTNIPCKIMEPMRKSKTLPASLANSPNVEHIVREFESGFMSPRSNFDSTSGNFVKRIVAAFEEKYNNNADECLEKSAEKLRDSRIHRHSFSNICQTLHFANIEISKCSSDISSTSSQNKDSSLDTNSTRSINSDMDFSLESKTNCVQRDPMVDHYGHEAKIHHVQRDPKVDLYYDLYSKTDFDTKIKPDFHSDETDNSKFDSGENLRASKIEQYLDRKSLQEDESSTLKRKERAPIIIGAFLKKPVKVEEISVNWIPFPGKKLPRKKSLKKLLSTLSGKRSNEKKKEVVFSSQININEENRELPDSGYDEQSLSSSSLTSITSNQKSSSSSSLSSEKSNQVRCNEEQKRRDRIYANSCAVGNWSTMPMYNRKSTNLSTFQSCNNAIGSGSETSGSSNGNKILLYEIPRDEVKVDLGPCYPSPSKIMVKSLDRKLKGKSFPLLEKGDGSREVKFSNVNRVPKHPMSARIPKHPFIALIKDEFYEPDDEEDGEYEEVSAEGAKGTKGAERLEAVKGTKRAEAVKRAGGVEKYEEEEEGLEDEEATEFEEEEDYEQEVYRGTSYRTSSYRASSYRTSLYEPVEYRKALHHQEAFEDDQEEQSASERRAKKPSERIPEAKASRKSEREAERREKQPKKERKQKEEEKVIMRKHRELRDTSFHSSENEYDVPRKYLSRSEPEIPDVIKFSFDLCLDEMNNYDVPKLRPKSSVYEDALSLKRRNADFVNVSPGSSQDYYSSPSPPQYATIKSKNKRYLSPEVFRSADELRSICTKVTSF